MMLNPSFIIFTKKDNALFRGTLTPNLNWSGVTELRIHSIYRFIIKKMGILSNPHFSFNTNALDKIRLRGERSPAFGGTTLFSAARNDDVKSFNALATLSS
jgi:hypothetical protein